jgi:hypothetical protein
MGGPGLGPFIFNNVILYEKMRNFKKKLKKNPSNFFMIFSYISLPILHNIELYIYTVRYKSSIKIPDFLLKVYKLFLNNSKKSQNFFELISYLKKTNKKNIFMHMARS